MMLKFDAFLKEFLNNEDLYLEDLYEAKDDTSRECGASNNTKGVLHELLVGKHLNNGTHMENHVSSHGDTPTQVHDKLKSNTSKSNFL